MILEQIIDLFKKLVQTIALCKSLCFFTRIQSALPVLEISSSFDTVTSELEGIDFD